jgi:hypothetical protein
VAEDEATTMVSTEAGEAAAEVEETIISREAALISKEEAMVHHPSILTLLMSNNSHLLSKSLILKLTCKRQLLPLRNLPKLKSSLDSP